jgi:hypothetical protein
MLGNYLLKLQKNSKTMLMKADKNGTTAIFD